MLFTSGKSPHKAIAEDVYKFFTDLYEIESDVEIYHTDLSDDNATGFTEVNGEEQFVQIHNNLNEYDYVVTLLHELIHVVQNEQGLISDEVREDQAYHMEEFYTTNGVPVGKVSTNRAQTPKIVYLIGVEGTAPHHTPNPFYSPLMRKIEAQMIAAINNNKDWQSANTSVHLTKRMKSPSFVFTATKLPRLVMTSFKSLMVVGRLTPLNLVSTLSSMSSAMQSLMVSFRRTFSGTFVTTMWFVISTTVTSSPDTSCLKAP